MLFGLDLRTKLLSLRIDAALLEFWVFHILI